MASSNFAPEIKSAMVPTSSTKGKARPNTRPDPGDTPADMARDKQRGIVEDSPRDLRIDAQGVQSAGAQPSPAHPPMQAMHSPAHAAIAASIAHAILGKSGGGY